MSDIPVSTRDRILANMLKNPSVVVFSFLENEQTISNEEALNYCYRLREKLAELGHQRRDNVAIVHDQSPGAYLTQMGLFLLGVPYVVLDEGTPSERMGRIIAKLASSVVFCGDKMRTQSQGLCSNTVTFLPSSTEDTSRGFALEPIEKSDLAYIVLTSGSTGEPKAVKISHENLDHFVEWALETFSLHESDVFPTLNPPHFDNAVFDFFCSRSVGARTFVIPTRTVQNPHQLADALCDSGSTVWFSVPSLLIYLQRTKVLRSDVLKGFRRILFGGEGFPKPQLTNFLAQVPEKVCRVWNVYGPSECACMCSAFELEKSQLDTFDDLPPIGEISERFRWELKNEDERGVGELFLEGPQVGLGYFADDSASRNSFSQREASHFGGHVRGYYTGDLMRVDDYGRLRFMGRIDSQVKVMGRRIELGEIESEILRSEGCFEVCVALPKSKLENEKLVAWVGGTCSPEEIRASLVLTLPDYMIPKKIISMATLPKNRNGKIDRASLIEGLYVDEA